MRHETEAPVGTAQDPNITFSDGRFRCGVVTDPDELRSCFRLRHRYYVSEKSWVAADVCLQGLEQDAYDERALHLAIFEEKAAIAYLRVLPHESGQGFMLDREFRALLPERERHSLVREGAAEISRLVCHPNFLKEANGQVQPLELLFKLFYHVSQECGFSRFYIVVEEGWLRLFARRFGLSFHIIGHLHTFPDGTRTVAGVATLEELEDAVQRHSPVKRAWYGSKG